MPTSDAETDVKLNSAFKLSRLISKCVHGQLSSVSVAQVEQACLVIKLVIYIITFHIVLISFHNIVISYDYVVQMSM